MIAWIKGYATLLIWMTGISLITFVGTIIAIPWLVVRIPSDYFSEKRRVRKLWASQHPLVRAILLTAKNLLGFVLILAGIIMLAIPGQGMLTILIGLLLLDLPGKYRIERWVITRPAVLRSINWLRRRARRAPLVL